MDIVFFDLDGTLLDNTADFRAVFVDVLGRHGVPISPVGLGDALETCWPWYEEQVGRFKGDEMSFWMEFNTRVARAAGADGGAEGVGRAITEAFGELDAPRLFPDVLPALDALASGGYRLGVITARPDARRVLQPQGITDRFEVVVDAFSAGSAKQDPTAFEYALRLARVPPGRAVHIGDQPERDVYPAQAAGLEAVLIDRQGRYEGADCVRVAGLEGFLSWLDGARA